VENATLEVPIPKEELVDGKAKRYGKSIVFLTAHDGGGGVVKNGNREPQGIGKPSWLCLSLREHNNVQAKRSSAETRCVVQNPCHSRSVDTYPEVEWMWWLDIDAMITNEEVELASHILNRHVLKERSTYERSINDIGNSL